MKKWQIENSEKSEILEISEKLFEFLILAVGAVFHLKISKKFSEISEFLAWPKKGDLLQVNKTFTAQKKKKNFFSKCDQG